MNGSTHKDIYTMRMRIACSEGSAMYTSITWQDNRTKAESSCSKHTYTGTYEESLGRWWTKECWLLVLLWAWHLTKYRRICVIKQEWKLFEYVAVYILCSRRDSYHLRGRVRCWCGVVCWGSYLGLLAFLKEGRKVYHHKLTKMQYIILTDNIH